MTTPITPQQADREAAAAFFRDTRTPLSVKMTLGYDPTPLLEAFAHHAQQARLEERERLGKTLREVSGLVAAAFDGTLGAAQALDACDDIAKAAIRNGMTPSNSTTKDKG